MKQGAIPRLAAAALLTGVIGFASAPVGAQTAITRNISVSATVNSTCNITSPTTGNPITLSFGTVDVLTIGGSTDVATSFTLQCNKGTTVTVALDGGLYNSSGKRMKNSGTSDYLAYRILIPSISGTTTTCPGAGSGTDWDSTNTLAATSLFTSTGGPRTVQVCGRISNDQPNVPAGSYSDTVVLSATYN